jgi:hypothetical protein
MTFEFDAIYGDTVKRVRVGQIFGAGDCWHVHLDDYFQGRVDFEDGDWIDVDERFDTPEITAIAERITEYLTGHKQ